MRTPTTRGAATRATSPPRRREGVLRTRLGEVDLQTLPYGEVIDHQGVRVSFHPAGHVLGSAQVRLEHAGRVWVASGDYYVAGAHADAREDNMTCAPFEPVRCHCFISESTFGLPIYRWRPQAELFAAIDAWWRGNAEAGRASLLHGLQLRQGAAHARRRRCVDRADLRARRGRAAEPRLPCRRRRHSADAAGHRDQRPPLFKRALVVAPPSVQGSTWTRRLGDYSDAFASGWMQLRGARRRRSVDRGFVLSDHADWPGLQRAIAATGAERVIVTHGYEAVMVRWLAEQGLEASAFETEYGDSDDDEPAGETVVAASDTAATPAGASDDLA